MSGTRWMDEGREERVAFLEDTPHASNGLLNESTSSNRLTQTVRVSTATLSGKVKPKSFAQDADKEHELFSSLLSENVLENTAQDGGLNRVRGNGTAWQRPKWSKNTHPPSSTVPPNIAAAQRDVEITPKLHQQSSPNFSPPEAQESPTTEQAVIPVSKAAHPPASAPTIAHALVRRAGHSSLVRNGLNRISTVNEVVSRFAPDDPIAQGTTSAIRGSVQAATTVSTAKRTVFWTWRTSYRLLHGAGSVVHSIRTQGLISTAVGLLKSAGGGMVRIGAALLGKAFFGFLTLLLVVLLIIMPLANLIGMGTDMSFGIPGNALDELYDYCTQLDADWTVRVNQELNRSGYDEVRLNCNGGQVSDPSSFAVKTNINQLLIYLQLINSDKVHTVAELKSQIDRIYASLYSISGSSSTETLTETKTVHAGESLGTVVTSAYCNCSLCCGKWAGGPTYSGVFPEANHTLAVDAYTPTVPVGTEIIMNGTLYKVEDTGAFSRYGVDFDVYMDSHSEALNWGHRSFEAFVAGPEGTEVTVTVTHTVSIYNVNLTANTLYQQVNTLISENESAKSHMELIQEFGAYAGYAIGGNPFGEGNRWIVRERFGSYADGTHTASRNFVTVHTAPGREVFSPLNGLLMWSGSTATITSTSLNGSITVKISGLSSRKSNGAVTSGTLIGTAQSESITIALSQEGKPKNPVIYLANAPGAGGNEAIVEAAMTQLGQRGGQPFWSWYGFDSRVSWCACFVSWCANQCDLISAGLIPKYSACADGAAWFQSNGHWAGRGYSPSPGDIIFFINAGDSISHHTGIVVSCDGSTVQTIEGNSGDAVRIRNYGINDSYILGYGIPEY